MLMSLDTKDAFNTADRQEMMDQLGEHFPHMIEFLWQFYGAPPELWFFQEDGSVETIYSERGCQQGVSAGMFLFAAAQQPALERIKEEFPDAMVAAFADDILLGTEMTRAPNVHKQSSEILLTYHQEVADENSFAYSPHWKTEEDTPRYSRERGVKCVTDGIRVVGGRIGTDDYIMSS